MILNSEVRKIISIIKNLLRQSRRRKNAIDDTHIVPRSEHNVSKTDINPNALKVLNIIYPNDILVNINHFMISSRK